VQLQGQESVGATVMVKPDNTWVYRPNNKKIQTWDGQYPPVKAKSKNDDNPVLVIQALTETHRTKVQFVDYTQLKKQSDKKIRLTYEQLPSAAEDTTSSRETERLRDDSGGGIRP
jgi:hypothetical protein